MTLTTTDTTTEIAETETAAELQPVAEPQELAHDPHPSHDGHDHTHEGNTHEAEPSLNPELMREIAVEVDAATVSKAFDRVVKKYQKLARIPGFRVGKVPATVIKNRVAKDVRQEVLDELVSERFRQAIVEQNVSPVSQPQLTNLMLVEGQPLQFKAAFEVLPQVDLTGYESMSVARPNVQLTEAEYKAELDRVLDPHASVETIEDDRPLVDGDWAEIEFKGQVQDLAQTVGEEGVENSAGPEEAEPIVGEEVMIEVGGVNTLPAFTDALRGAKAGQEMQFEVTYPQDFGEVRLAGQTVKYDVTVKAIKSKSFPERDEEFAKQLGGYESWEDFETKLREHASGRKKDALENQAKDKLLGDLIQRYQFPVPESFVQQQIDARLDRGLRALAQQGMTADDMRKLDFGRLRAAQRDQAVNEVKASLILDALAEKEGVQVEDEEIERELLMASLQAREPIETLRARMIEDGSLSRMRDQIRREKTGAVLYEKLAQ
jgi:trigger factor